MSIAKTLVEEMLDAIEKDSALAQRVRRAFGAAALPCPTEEFLTRRQARATLGLEERVIVRAERGGALPAYRAGRAVTYRRADLVALVEKCRVEPRAETTTEDAELDSYEVAKRRLLGRRTGAASCPRT